MPIWGWVETTPLENSGLDSSSSFKEFFFQHPQCYLLVPSLLRLGKIYGLQPQPRSPMSCLRIVLSLCISPHGLMRVLFLCRTNEEVHIGSTRVVGLALRDWRYVLIHLLLRDVLLQLCLCLWCHCIYMGKRLASILKIFKCLVTLSDDYFYDHSIKVWLLPLIIGMVPTKTLEIHAHRWLDTMILQ